MSSRTFSDVKPKLVAKNGAFQLFLGAATVLLQLGVNATTFPAFPAYGAYYVATTGGWAGALIGVVGGATLFAGLPRPPRLRHRLWLDATALTLQSIVLVVAVCHGVYVGLATGIGREFWHCYGARGSDPAAVIDCDDAAYPLAVAVHSGMLLVAFATILSAGWTGIFLCQEIHEQRRGPYVAWRRPSSPPRRPAGRTTAGRRRSADDDCENICFITAFSYLQILLTIISVTLAITELFQVAKDESSGHLDFRPKMELNLGAPLWCCPVYILAGILGKSSTSPGRNRQVKLYLCLFFNLFGAILAGLMLWENKHAGDNGREASYIKDRLCHPRGIHLCEFRDRDRGTLTNWLSSFNIFVILSLVLQMVNSFAGAWAILRIFELRGSCCVKHDAAIFSEAELGDGERPDAVEMEVYSVSLESGNRDAENATASNDGRIGVAVELEPSRDRVKLLAA